MQYDDEVFYKDGLEFECTRCSNCCRHEPGYVFLTKRDLSALAAATGMTTDEVVEKYCRRVNIGPIERLSLTEKPNYDCVFWEDTGCAVYHHRPVQCKTYPFWSTNLMSRESWDSEGESCPGINRGKRHSRRKIERLIKMREIETPLP